jgi:hypothetical protein
MLAENTQSNLWKLTVCSECSTLQLPSSYEPRRPDYDSPRPNDFGKTTILRMANRLFRGRYAEMRRIPFKTFQVDLENGETVKVTKRPHKNPSKDPRKREFGSLLIQLSKDGNELHAVFFVASTPSWMLA